MHPLWSSLFDRPGPVEIEIGPERGTFLLASAAAHPERNYLGIERSTPRARRLERSVAAAGLANARALCADAVCVVANCSPVESVTAYHIYFPDPWWKRRHHRRRLLTPEFAAALARTLATGGAIHLVTDVEGLFHFAMRSLAGEPSLVETVEVPERHVRTAFEKKALGRGDRLFVATMTKLAAAVQRQSA